MPEFIGPNGAHFHVEPGSAFTQDDIDAKVSAGKWTPVDSKPSSTAKKAASSKAKQ